MNQSRKSRLLLLALGVLLGLVFPFSGHAQALEYNVKVKAGSATETFLRTRADAFSPAMLRDVRQVPHLQGIEAVSALKSQAKRSGKSPVEGIYTLRFQGDALSALTASGEFEWVEINRVRPLHLPSTAPNDPLVSEQWYHSYIQTFPAWDSTRGASSVVVGVLDTGLDFDHPEFEGQIAINPLEDRNGNGRFDYWQDTVAVAGVFGDLDGIDQDGNGYADDVVGYDFTDQPRSPFGGDYLFADPVPADDNNHGTLVGGIIAARADNNYGGSGVAPGCKLKVLRAFSANGSGEDDDVARAIVYAADNGIKILNFSFGDIYPSQTMHAAIQYAYSMGVVMVASAGNGTGDNLHYPSGYDEVISVGASAVLESGEEVLWPLSSYGHTLSLVAPGSGILCPVVRDTLPETDDFDTFSGTSCSAPMVSAAVALLFSQRGECSPQQVRGILTGSADDVSSPGWDHYTGAGRLNVLKALQQVGGSDVQILSPANDSGTNQDSLWIVASALDPEGVEIMVDFQAGVEGFGEWFPIAEGLTEQVWQDTLAVWDLRQLPEGEYTLRLMVAKSDGSTAEDRVRVVIDRTAPDVDIRVSAPAWDNAQRAYMVVFRNSDRGRTQLQFRPLNTTAWQTLTHDRITRNGNFLLGPDVLTDGLHEFRLGCTNEAGLSTWTDIDTLSFSQAFISDFGYEPTGHSIPMGHYLQEPQDLDNDGLLEVVMSRYTDNLGFGRLMHYEYNAVGFTAIDSLTFKSVLIPKSMEDADGDGLMELLCSVNDSMYVLEQSAPLQFPQNIRYRNEGQSLYAATFADADNDATMELMLKDAVDYRVFEPNGSGFQAGATLPDPTGGYIGSVAPRLVVEDLDGDGLRDIVMGDYDGDFVVYEHDGSGYQLRFVDSTALEHASDYIVAGDFNGNGKPEIFVAVHSSLNRNEIDFEYESPLWWLRIFEATVDNTYSQVWEDYLYDIDTQDYNAATPADLDNDAQDELIFTTFPRTYVIDHDGTDYKMDWFHYGALGTHHMAGDFNQDGVQEFALGRGDSAFFFQKDLSYNGPGVVANLDGYIPASQTAQLTWSAVGDATYYRIWRGDYNGPGSIQIFLVDSTASIQYTDTALTNGQPYLYVVESANPGLSQPYSPFSYAILLTPKILGGLDSAYAVGPQLLMLEFDVPVRADESLLHLFGLDSAGNAPVAVVSGTGGTSTLLLTFAEPLLPGAHQVFVDEKFLDSEDARLDSARRQHAFVYNPDTARAAYFVNWRVVDPQTAEIKLNLPMTTDALEAANWSILPFGTVEMVSYAGSDHKSLRVQVKGCALGSIGYPVSLTLERGTAENGAKILEKEGNTATFSSHQADLSAVYVYPNPYLDNDVFEGIRFANLTRTATVQVLTASGQKIITLTETDGDGGLEWNLIDQWGERIRPGVYLYKVEAEGVEGIVGKFSVLK